MTCDWQLVTGPEQEPIGIDVAKLHCRVESDDDLGLLDSACVAARQAFELYANRGAFTQTWRMVLSDFADVITLAMAAPLASITSVQYYDAAGALTTLATTFYEADTFGEPARLMRKPNQVWPVLQADRSGPRVIVTYVVGWANVEDIPALIKQGMLLLAAHFYRNPEAVNVGNIVTALPFGVESCWAPYRAWWKPPSCAA